MRRTRRTERNTGSADVRQLWPREGDVCAFGSGDAPVSAVSEPQDLTLGAYVVVQATVVPGPTPSGGLGSVVPLSDVTILWQAARNNPLPRAIEDSVVLQPGRYLLLLGAGRAGHWYAAMGYRGVFAYVDPQGNTLTELCVTYSSDGTVHPATKAPGSISRTELLALVKAAPLPDPMYSPPP
jgi:hypothetical protein